MKQQQKQALTRAITLLVLVGVARLLPDTASRAVALLAAFLQMYWPLVAHEKNVVRYSESPWTRLYVRQSSQELALATLCLLVTLPPWAALASLVGAHSPFGDITPKFTWGAVYSVADMCLVAAQEEWFWRGYVQPSLGGDTRAIGTTSILFGACHWAYSGSPFALATAMPSVVFGFLAARHGRLLAATCVHIGYNLASQLWIGS